MYTNALNIWDIRIKNCIYSDSFQHVTLLLESIDINKSPNNKQPVHFLTFRPISNPNANTNSNAIAHLKQKLDSNYESEEFPEYVAFRRKNPPSEVLANLSKTCRKMCDNCCKWGFCQLAFQIQLETGKNLQDFMTGSEMQNELQRPENDLFMIHACLDNTPGTLHKFLTGFILQKNINTLTSRDTFYFNIEHLRCTICRSMNNAVLDIYISYDQSSSQSRKNSIGKSNGVAFYFGGKNTVHVFNDEHIKKGKLYQKLKNDGLDKYNYQKSNAPIPLSKEEQLNCPVATYGNCRMDMASYQQFEHGTNIAKLEVCMENTPGSLLETINLLTKAR